MQFLLECLIVSPIGLEITVQAVGAGNCTGSFVVISQQLMNQCLTVPLSSVSKEKLVRIRVNFHSHMLESSASTCFQASELRAR